MGRLVWVRSAVAIWLLIQHVFSRCLLDFSRDPIESEESHILLFTVLNALYPINVDVMQTICSPFGNILRILIFKKNDVQSMVE
jgi:hypothetical protein